MKKLDSLGRIRIPKEIIVKNNYKANELFDIFEKDDGIFMRPTKIKYQITEEEMNLIRKIYNMIEDVDLLDENELEELRNMCKFTDINCPNCNRPLVITNDNSYKCINCEE